MVALKPFLKWVGGKAWMVPRLSPFIPAQTGKYIEPFLGGGAVFFAACNGQRAILSDTNSELINAYAQIRDNCSAVIKYLREFPNTEKDYYAIRDSRFRGAIKEAARFIYLNRTCYNGVYRVNRDGKFNVPYGHNPEALVYDSTHLKNISRKLARAELKTCDFDSLRKAISPGDFVFIDPPYTVAHGNNGFVEYNKRLFTWGDQHRLASFVEYIDTCGAFFVLTNAAHSSIKELYSRLGCMFEMERHSTITSRVKKRSRTTELLFTNCK